MNQKNKYTLFYIAVIFLIIAGVWLLMVSSVTQPQVKEPGDSSGPIALQVEIGKRVSGLGVTIAPVEVLEKSGCPVDGVWIQAGTVRLRAKLTSGLGSAEQIFKLGEPITTEAEEVTFTEVSPAPHSQVKIAPSDYSFTFKIAKRIKN